MYSAGSPIYVVNDMIIHAVAFRDGWEVIDVLTLSYRIDSSTRPLSLSGVEYIGEASGSSGSLLKMTFSKAVDKKVGREWQLHGVDSERYVLPTGVRSFRDLGRRWA